MCTLIGIMWVVMGFIMFYADKPIESAAVSFIVAAIYFFVGECSVFRNKFLKIMEDKHERVRKGSGIPEDEGA